MEHRGFMSWVSTGIMFLPVYSTEKSGQLATGWIPSEAGEHFSIHVQALDTDVTARHCVVAQVHVDGALINTSAFGYVPQVLGETRSHRVDVQGHRAGSELHRLIFSTLTLTDEEDNNVYSNSGLIDLNRLGTIQVDLRRALIRGDGKPATRDIEPPTTLSTKQMSLHEKAKKIGGHHSMLGQAERTATVMAVDFIYIDKQEPYAKFVFRYAPITVLQAHGRAPPTPILDVKPLNLKRRVLEDNALQDVNGQGSSPLKRERRERPVKSESIEGQVSSPVCPNGTRRARATPKLSHNDSLHQRINSSGANMMSLDGRERVVIDLTLDED